jgi:uncharacterized protein (TIGR02266 family)
MSIMHTDATELARLEIEAHQIEARLEHEMSIAREKAEQVATRLAVLQAFAQQAGEEAPMLVLPRIDFDDDARGQVLQARRSALEQRSAVALAFQASLDALQLNTAELEQTLNREAERLARSQRAREHRPPTPAPVVHRPRSARERRQSPRVVLCTEVELGCDANRYAGFSTDISDTGIFVASVMTPPPGSLIDVRFTLPNGDLIEATGMVRWTRDVNDATPDVMPGAGIQFLELAPRAAAAISAFVAKREPLF